MIVEQMLKNAQTPLLHIADVSGSALFNADCMDILPLIPDKSVQLILADLPYGTTILEWDKILPMDKLWVQYKRVAKDNCAFVLFGAEPFSTMLRMSNIKWYKYDWIWNKIRATGNFLANKQPMRVYENIIVFYQKLPIYNSQLIPKDKKYIRHLKKSYTNNGNHIKDNYSAEVRTIPPEMKHPNNIITISGGSAKKMKHPTEKPLELMKFLIKTYSNENDMVLDNTMGSGTTPLAAKELNRSFIGIEKEVKYYDLAVARVFG